MAAHGAVLNNTPLWRWVVDLLGDGTALVFSRGEITGAERVDVRGYMPHWGASLIVGINEHDYRYVVMDRRSQDFEWVERLAAHRPHIDPIQSATDEHYWTMNFRFPDDLIWLRMVLPG